MSDNVSVHRTMADEQARKECRAELQLLLATLNVEDRAADEQVALDDFMISMTPKRRAALADATHALRAAVDEMELCQLQVAAVSP